ncbi:MAG TPA: LPXTG cell wall anchor domain-containing protein, partial [Aliiroseovarius sp.]|nr:LPXTG cell wall anchor domain-containing protein [Aliiroseovarius sp.]
IKPRRISREAIMDNTLWMGIALVGLLIVASMFFSRKRTNKGA